MRFGIPQRHSQSRNPPYRGGPFCAGDACWGNRRAYAGLSGSPRPGSMTGIPHLMQALIAEAHGEPLRLEQVSTPRPGTGEVLIRVAASAFNPLDAKILAGK